MRKEVVLALIIGGILGGIILYGIKIANQAVGQNQTDTKNSQNQTQTTNNTPTPTPTESLSVTTPQNHSVVFTPEITIQGVSAKPESTVVITSEKDEAIVESSSTNQFTTTFDLIGGENNLTFTEIKDNQQISVVTIQVIYTTSEIQ